VLPVITRLSDIGHGINSLHSSTRATQDGCRVFLCVGFGCSACPPLGTLYFNLPGGVRFRLRDQPASVQYSTETRIPPRCFFSLVMNDATGHATESAWGAEGSFTQFANSSNTIEKQFSTGKPARPHCVVLYVRSFSSDREACFCDRLIDDSFSKGLQICRCAGSRAVVLDAKGSECLIVHGVPLQSHFCGLLQSHFVFKNG